jgi:hypothetical protein
VRSGTVCNRSTSGPEQKYLKRKYPSKTRINSDTMKQAEVPQRDKVKQRSIDARVKRKTAVLSIKAFLSLIQLAVVIRSTEVILRSTAVMSKYVGSLSNCELIVWNCGIRS